MKLTVIETGYFKLDGGAMFGVVPKTIWQKLEKPDDNNLCTWQMRCLLVQTDDGKNILIDTGLGNKQSDKFFSHYHPHGEASLMKSLSNAGLQPKDITDVFLTHLHFDHVGGAVKKDENGKLLPAFPNATYWSNEKHWNWAMNPNAREKASFLKENFVPLQEAGQLRFFDAVSYDAQVMWFNSFNVLFAYGHTEAMMLPYLMIGGKKVVYCADLLPSPSHIPLAFVMGYDIRPMQTLEEKEYFLERAVNEKWILFFEHSKSVEACTVVKNEIGRVVVDKTGDLKDFL